MLHKSNIVPLADLFAADPRRAAHFSLAVPGALLDYARVPIDGAARERLHTLCDQAELASAIRALLDGAMVNESENRAALHPLLRHPDPESGDTRERARGAGIAATRRRMLALAGRLHDGQPPGPETPVLTDWLHVGIGGSDLGPRLVASALDPGTGACRIHWLNTLDTEHWEDLAARLDPRRTGMLIASKSFGTEETLQQAQAVRAWLGTDWAARCWAATANPARATAFGLPAEQVLSFPEAVGGRYSLWSSVGTSAAARIGTAAFEALLAGAHQADRELTQVDWSRNPAAVLATCLHFLRVDCGFPALGVVSYEPRLALLSEWLQQLIMESLGKRVDRDGHPLHVPGAPLIFGGRGTDLQHSVFQSLHQGGETHPVLFVGTVHGPGQADWRRRQLAHALAQGLTLMRGAAHRQPERVLPGGRPSMTLLLERLEPVVLGQWLAWFEHAVFMLGRLWRVNPFDQWGVEEGKRVAADILRDLTGDAEPPPELAALFEFARR